MKITVTQDIINEGCKAETFGDLSNCPIATAVFRQLNLGPDHVVHVVDRGSEKKGYTKPRVTINVYERAKDFDPWVRRGERDFIAGRSAHRFINRFDRQKSVKPFTFILKEVS